MPNPENITPPKKGEPSRNPNGRPKGSPNRSTVLKRWIKLKITFPNQDEETGEKQFEGLQENIKITLEDSIALALLQKAQSGDVSAIKEINDTLYGKIVDKQDLTSGGEKIGQPAQDLSKLSTEDLLKLKEIQSKLNAT